MNVIYFFYLKKIFSDGWTNNIWFILQEQLKGHFLYLLFMEQLESLLVKNNLFLILDSIKDHNGSLTRDSKICIPSTQTFRLRRNFLETINWINMMGFDELQYTHLYGWDLPCLHSVSVNTRSRCTVNGYAVSNWMTWQYFWLSN